MTRPRKWTPDDTTTLKTLHAQGKSLHAIATHMGRAKSTVGKYAKQAGLTWDRARTAEATKAKVVDAAARRAAAVETELDLLEASQTHIRDGLQGRGWRTFMRTTGGGEQDVTLGFVPARDLREHTAARNAMAGIIARLDHTDPAVEQGRSMLDALARSLGVQGPTDA